MTSEMRVSIDVGNKADDFAYPGKVIVTYPSLLGYIGAEAKQVCWNTSIGIHLSIYPSFHSIYPSIFPLIFLHIIIHPIDVQGVQCNRMDRGEETEKAVCIVGMPFKGRTQVINQISKTQVSCPSWFSYNIWLFVFLQKSFDLTFTTSDVKGNISEFYIELFATRY